MIVRLPALNVGDLAIFTRSHDSHEGEIGHSYLTPSHLTPFHITFPSDTHEIKSNRESGYGRYDIMIIPHDKTKIGYVIQFKTVDQEEGETVKAATAAAHKQIKKKLTKPNSSPAVSKPGNNWSWFSRAKRCM